MAKVIDETRTGVYTEDKEKRREVRLCYPKKSIMFWGRNWNSF